MEYKKITVLALCLALALSFASCGKKNDVPSDQRGDVKTEADAQEKPDNKKNDDVLGDYIFEKTENDTGVRYKLLKDGYGHIAIPYPEGSKITREGSNQVKIYNQQMNATFIIEYVSVLPDTTTESYFEMTPDKLTDLFHWQLNEQTFVISGVTYQRGVDQSSSKDEGLKEINKDDLMLIRCDFKELHTVSDGENDYKIAAERRYYIRNGNVYMCISAIGEQIDFEYTKEMIDYMVSNMRAYDEDLERSTIPVSIGGDSVNISSLFEDHEYASLRFINADGMFYKVPDDKGSTMSGSFFSVMEVSDKDKVLNERRIDNNEIFLFAHPSVASCTKNADAPFKYEPDQEQFSALYPVKESLKNKGYETGDLFGSYLSIYRTDRGGSYLIEHGDTWIIDEFTATKDGNTYLVIFGFPDIKYNDAVKVAGNMVK